MSAVTLDAREVRESVSMAAAIAAVRQAFLDLAAGDFEQPVRTAMRDGRFLVMSTHHRPTATAIVKSLSVDFDRVPAIAGTVTWMELDRARTLVADAGEITALRTGAVAGVATDLLAPPDADTMAIIGAGAQAPDQIRAVHAVRPLRRLSIVGRDGARARSLAEAMRRELPDVEVEAVASVDAAVRDADIVTCATPATEPVLAREMLTPRVHVNAIGSFRPTMRELPDDLLAESTVVVDDLPAVLEEAGEVIHALGSGAVAQSDLVELGSALARPPGGRDRTVFKSVGVAAQDWAIARLLAATLLD